MSRIKSFILAGLALFLIVVAIDCSQEQAPLKSLGIDTSMQLQDQHGQEFNMQDMRGKVLWVYFGFTWCPEFCPMTQSKLQKAWRKMDYRKKNLVSVFISVDPKRDTPQRIDDFLSNYEMQSVGLRGELPEIQKIADQFHVFFEKVPLGSQGNYTVNHSTSVFLIDTNGEVRTIFKYDTSVDYIARMSAMLLPPF